MKYTLDDWVFILSPLVMAIPGIFVGVLMLFYWLCYL